jgi:hypothetical protein
LNDRLKNEGLELKFLNYRLRNEGLDQTLSNDWLKMRGWKRHCLMIGYKMRSGTDIVDLLSHFPMIGAQLCCMAT